MVKNTIVDGSGSGSRAYVTNDPEEPNSLIVATRPYKSFLNNLQFFINDEHGADMNIDAGASGTPVKVHNGTDDILWTATDIVGGAKTTFNSSDQNHTPGGALSVKVDNSPVGDVFQFAGTDIDLNNYVAISMWIYVDADWANGDIISLYGWDTDTNSQVGISVDLKTYFAHLSYDEWHELKISLADMELFGTTTVDALRVSIDQADGKSPKFYIDDIQFEEFGTPTSYELRPRKGEWLHIRSFQFSIVANIAGTLSDATVPYIAYDSLLGTNVPVGIIYQRVQGGENLFSLPIRGVMDVMQLAGATVEGSGSDGTNMWLSLSVHNNEEQILKPENGDFLRFIVNDDLSGLLHLRVNAGSWREDREANK